MGCRSLIAGIGDLESGGLQVQNFGVRGRVELGIMKGVVYVCCNIAMIRLCTCYTSLTGRTGKHHCSEDPENVKYLVSQSATAASKNTP